MNFPRANKLYLIRFFRFSATDNVKTKIEQLADFTNMCNDYDSDHALISVNVLKHG